MKHSQTQRLTRASLELSSRDERRRRTATAATIILGLALAVTGVHYLGVRFPVPGVVTAPATLARENAELRAELQRMRTEFAMEQATRGELNRQAGHLHAQIKELTNRLEFLAARDTRPDEPR